MEHTLGYDTPEKWTRTATHSHGGHLSSIFQATFDEPSVVNDIVDWAPDGVLREKQYVHHFSTIPLGHLALSPEYTPQWHEEAHVEIRRVPLNLPPSPVRRINSEAQYSSHVVNLVVPTYADDAVIGIYDLEEITRSFYLYFGDDYDALGIMPYAMGANSSSTYHITVQNQIGCGSFASAVQRGPGGAASGMARAT